MRLRTTRSTAPRAAVALARAVGVSAAEAKALLASARVLPLELTPEAAGAVSEALAACGVSSQPVDAPPTTLRCAAHPRLTADLSCGRCGAAICPLCAQGPRGPRCLACAAAERRSATWKWRRVAVLLLVLVPLAGLGLRQSRRRAARLAWARPLTVSVVLHSEAPVEAAVVDTWREGLVALEAWFTAEAARLEAPLPRPLSLSLVEPVRGGPRPRQPEPTGAWLDDVRAARAFRSALDALAAPTGDVRLVVSLGASGAGRGRFVEGAAERYGEVGLVLAPGGEPELALELTAVAHELLHCLGAVDAYEPSGRARVPDGLAEPERVPPFPQRFAEVMVGELPVSPDAGRVPRSLEEVRIGPATARAIGWTR